MLCRGRAGGGALARQVDDRLLDLAEPLGQFQIALGRGAALTGERETLEAEIEPMIGDMAAAPAEARASGDWAERGAATKRYLELTERLGEVEQAIIDLTHQRAASGPAPTKH